VNGHHPARVIRRVIWILDLRFWIFTDPYFQPLLSQILDKPFNRIFFHLKGDLMLYRVDIPLEPVQPGLFMVQADCNTAMKG